MSEGNPDIEQVFFAVLHSRRIECRIPSVVRCLRSTCSSPRTPESPRNDAAGWTCWVRRPLTSRSSTPHGPRLEAYTPQPIRRLCSLRLHLHGCSQISQRRDPNCTHAGELCRYNFTVIAIALNLMVRLRIARRRQHHRGRHNGTSGRRTAPPEVRRSCSDRERLGLFFASAQTSRRGAVRAAGWTVAVGTVSGRARTSGVYITYTWCATYNTQHATCAWQVAP